MKKLFNILLLFGAIALNAQQNNPSQNTADKLIENSGTLNIGGYGQVDYNQPLNGDTKENGNLDVHRLVLLFGYKFDSKTSFVTEVEFEHVKEVFVEQMFMNYRFNQSLNFRAGLMLVPMGIVNEYHEPPTFNGVERPNLDKIIVPTTWREIGMGLTGRIDPLSLRYQAYILNGFNGYDGSAKFSGKNGLRSGRQKGAESFSSAPNFAAKVDYYGISGLKLGLSGYFGDSQSTLQDGIDKNDRLARSHADSSVVGIAMLGLDARYNLDGFEFRGQYNLISLSNTAEYNAFTGSDVGSKKSGYYAEVGYDIFHTNKAINTRLVPFFRYETYNTHAAVAENMTKNKAFKRTELTAGIGLKLNPGTVLKMDYQWFKTDANDDFRGQLNLGLGVWFF